jgi:hypothetical protein
MLVEWLISGTFTALASWAIHSKQDLDIPDGEFVWSCRKVFSSRFSGLDVYDNRPVRTTSP